MSSSSDLTQFGIYLAKIYFADKPEVFKVRPVLVIDMVNQLVLALKMSSRVRQVRVPSYILADWQHYGLNVPTAVLLSPLLALPGHDLYSERLLGVLNDQDIQSVLSGLADLRVG
ncbi:MAG: hypothetical protein LBP28_03935 [Coriobacteriales bacterium]|jgi:hypothetical protein|nr:hypothetical protein [Coriobacteriales bacterium]